MITPEQKIQKARAGLVLDHPFFGMLALKLKYHEDPACETMYTDGRNIGWNPKFVESLTLEQIKGVICHEVLHCVMAHCSRRGARDGGKWNMAGDYTINPIVLEARLSLPKGHLRNQQYDDKTADEIYTLIPDPPKGGNGGSGKGDPGGCGEVRDAQGKAGQAASEADRKQIEEEWKVEAARAAQQAKSMGKLPAKLERLVEDVLKPVVDWRQVLREFVSACAKTDYTWRKPNRRFISRDLYLPSIHGDELLPIGVAWDSSGSTLEHRSRFAAELNSILCELPISSVDIIYCDAEVNKVVTYGKEDLPVTLDKDYGGGGTSFCPPFEWAEENAKDYACFIYLTDMEGTFPNEPAPYPVLWAACGTDEQAPWGETIKVI